MVCGEGNTKYYLGNSVFKRDVTKRHEMWWSHLLYSKAQRQIIILQAMLTTRSQHEHLEAAARLSGLSKAIRTSNGLYDNFLCDLSTMGLWLWR